MYQETKKTLDLAHFHHRAGNKIQERQYLEETKSKVCDLLFNCR